MFGLTHGLKKDFLFTNIQLPIKVCLQVHIQDNVYTHTLKCVAVLAKYYMDTYKMYTYF